MSIFEKTYPGLWTIVCVASLCSGLFAQDYPIRDNFDDTSFPNRDPLTWRIGPGFSTTAVSIDADGLTLTGDGGEAGLVEVVDTSSNEWSMRTQFVRESGDLTGLGHGNGWAMIAGSNLSVGSGGTILDELSVDLNPRAKEVVLQLDTFDGELRGWAWEAGNPPTSEEPMVVTSLSLNRTPAIWTRDFTGGSFSSSTFRWFEYSDQHLNVVPEPDAPSTALGSLLLLLALRRRSRSSQDR